VNWPEYQVVVPLLALSGPSFNLSPLNTDSHHLAISDRLQFGDADLDPGRVEVLEDDLRDVFGKRFHQGEMPVTQHCLEMLRDIRVIQGVVDVVAETGAAVGQSDVEIDLQGLRHHFFALVDADERGDLEFPQEYYVHEYSLLVGQITWRKIRRTFILCHSRC
jgi:hypothetical protein